ncbi:MAG: hypothetical protein M1815_002048 [Lichina confinis]|nr:MAG: hypothetical protein M1815_002048 [Lichina confinis]
MTGISLTIRAAVPIRFRRLNPRASQDRNPPVDLSPRPLHHHGDAPPPVAITLVASATVVIPTNPAAVSAVAAAIDVLNRDGNIVTPGFFVVHPAVLVASTDIGVDRESRRLDEAVSGEAAAAAHQHTSSCGFHVRGCARWCARLGI